METRTKGRWLAIALLALAACGEQELTAPDRTKPPAALTPTALEPTGRAVVVFKSEDAIPQAGIDLVAALGGTISSRHDAIGVLFASGLTTTALQTLQQSDLVLDAGPDYELDWIPDDLIGPVEEVELGEPNTHDPTRASQFRVWQWGPQRIAADGAWAAGFVSDPSSRVAILDTGIDDMNRELRGLVDFASSRSFVETEPTTKDLHFHGTHVASTVVTNSVTIAGIAPHTTLIAVKVLSFQGSGTFEGVIGGIMHAADVDANVINMSLGAVFDKKEEGAKPLITALRRSVQYAQRRGTLVVSAAGNDAINFDTAGTLVTMPCMVSHICVSATGPLNGQFDANGPILTEDHDRPAVYTNYGFRAIHVAAPGGNFNPDDPDRSEGTWRVEDLIAGACSSTATQVPQCAVNNDLVAFYVFAAGTSMATPHVSGTAAMIQAQAGGSLEVDEVISRLLNFADDIGDPGPDEFSNHGRVNVFRSITQQ